MKAIVYHQYGGPEVLEYVDLPTPEPTENEVLVQIGASGLNPVDTYFRSGVRPVPSFPHIPHFDLAGSVVKVGANVTKWKVGDRVWATNIQGTAAEYQVVTEDKLFSLPDHMSFAEGAAVAMAFMTAHLALFARGKLSSDETVLIYGASGAVGQASVQLAKLVGATVIATAGNEEKAQVAKEAGAEHVILYRSEDIVKHVNEITSNTGVPLILDMSLSDNIERNFEMIKNRGRIVTIGSPNNNTPTLPWRLLNAKNASLQGILLFNAEPDEIQAAGEEIAKGLADKKLKAHIGAEFSLAEASTGHAALAEKKYNGSIVFIP